MTKPLRQAALVTGGAKRIGKEICLSLAQRGYDIALHYHHSQNAARRIADTIMKQGRICKIFPCDLLKESTTTQLLKKILGHFPHLNLLVNNASIFETSTFPKGSLQHFKRHFAIHLTAPYILTRDFANHCKQGHIINILDSNITHHSSRYFDYLLSKKTLLELTKMSARELAPRIRVNGIAPGAILPPADQSTQYIHKLVSTIPMKQKGHPKDITQCINFLLDSSFITGQIIFIDGGQHLL